MYKKIINLSICGTCGFLALWCVGDVIADHDTLFNLVTGIGNAIACVISYDKATGINNG
jgi:hypothetical protein